MTNIYLPEAKKEETEEEVDITKQETIEQLVIIDIYNSENGLRAGKKKERTRQKQPPPEDSPTHDTRSSSKYSTVDKPRLVGMKVKLLGTTVSLFG